MEERLAPAKINLALDILGPRPDGYHEMRMVMQTVSLCDRVALLHDGEIVEFGSPQEICLKYNRNKKYHVLLAGGRELELAQNPENIVKITRWMEGDEIMRIHSCEPTLETVFLEVTGKDLNV